ncbi:transglutaminase domain-containing protein [Micromonospora sp. NPDC005652]|uniref:transglutaminase domain-containing protein n=1 Tax=Micromonospora sp. NPDC005652 TaxID=3157046 RepID=UPI0033EAF68E
MTATSVLSDDLVTDAVEFVERLRRIPWSARRFAADTVQARREFGLAGPILDAVCSAGLPRFTRDDEMLFDVLDLMNLGLHLRLRGPHLGAMRFWGALLDRPLGQDRTYEINYNPICPVPGHVPDCEFLLRTPDETAVRVRRPASADGTVHTAVVRLRNDWPDAPVPVRELIEEITHIQQVRLPEIPRWDTCFALGSGIADCAGVARLLAERGRARGLAVRLRYGLIVAPPYSMQHFWAEFLVEERWVPYQPGLVNALVRWGVVASDRWPAHRSPGAILVGLSSQVARAATHHSFNVCMSFPTRLI